MSERAATVIPHPLSVVESNVWDVTSWDGILGDVDWVSRVAHERYLFGVRQGRRVHEVLAAVRWHARDHRATWRELDGPAWRGELRLTPLNGRRTRVVLGVTVHPRTLMCSVAEMLGRNHRDVEADLARVQRRLAAVPQPFRPVRLDGTPVPDPRAEAPGVTAAAEAVQVVRA